MLIDKTALFLEAVLFWPIEATDFHFLVLLSTVLLLYFKNCLTLGYPFLVKLLSRNTTSILGAECRKAK